MMTKAKWLLPLGVAVAVIGFQYLDFFLADLTRKAAVTTFAVSWAIVWNIVWQLAVGIALARPNWFKRGLTAPKLQISFPHLIVTLLLLCFAVYWLLWGYGSWLVWTTRFGAGIIWLFVGYFLARTLRKEERNQES